MKIKAKFIGQNGSLGYQKNKTYILEFIELNWWQSFIKGWKIEIFNKVLGYCPYKNLSTFLQNWKILETFK